jgi:hypothetical protein
VKITVEVDDLEPGRTHSHYVADYLRTMFRVRALRRALGEALIDAARRKQKLNATQLIEARELLGEMGTARRRLRLIYGPKRGPNRDSETRD